MTFLLALALSVCSWAGTPAPAAGEAPPCDAKAMTKALKDVAPAQAPTAFLELAVCSPDAARAAAKDVLPKILSSDLGNRAIEAAVKVGAHDEVRAWLESQEPSYRSTTVRYLGTKCNDSPTIARFFIESHDVAKTTFWNDRWYRGLADCRVEGIQKLLGDDVQERKVAKPGESRTEFFAILEVYARNLAGDAVPALGKLGDELNNEEELTYVVNAFADAAQVGSEAGMKADVAAAAVKEIERLAPKLPPKAIDQARTTLRALGNEDAATAIAKYRWKDRMVDGKYLYGVVAIERVTCKNQKTLAYYHQAAFTEPGREWPEQVATLLPEKLSYEWGMKGGDYCKGTGTTEWLHPDEPFADKAAETEWFDAKKRDFEKSVAPDTKVKILVHDDFAI